eukprot:202733_1
MSYEALILCVDTSGSMGGDKLKNAKELLLEMVVSFNCPNNTNYYKFDTEVTSIDKVQFEKLTASGGTKIEHAINKLYNEYIPKCSAYSTKFLFVTDAEDKISNIASCKKAKSECEAKFGGKLDSEAILTGSGSCASALKDIFGANSFYSCTDKQFKDLLGKMSDAINTANKISGQIPMIQKSCQNTANMMDNSYKQNNTNVDKATQSTKQVRSDAKKNLNEVKDDHKDIDQTVQQSKTNLNQLEQQTKDSKTGEENDAVDDSLEEQLDKENETADKVDDAKNKLEKAEKKVKEEIPALVDVAKKLQESNNEEKKAIGAVVSNIVVAVKEMNTIEAGSKEKINELKKKFNTMLSKLYLKAQAKRELAKKINTLRKEMKETFKEFNDAKDKNKEYQKQVAEHQKKLIELMNQLC